MLNIETVKNMNFNEQISLLKMLQGEIDIKASDIDTEEFNLTNLNYVSTLNPQSYGFKIEKMVSNLLSYSINPPTLRLGDFYDVKNDKNIEFKTSIIDMSNNKIKKINLVQIRAWENTDFLILGIVFCENKTYLFPFYLTNQQMKREINRIGAVAHGNGGKLKASSKSSRELSIRLSLSRTNNEFRRWFRNYKTDLFDSCISEGFVIPKQLNHINF